MKKNNNIKQLKEIVNNELFFDLNYQGVQAYNISSANEYEVIVGFRKSYSFARSLLIHAYS